MAKEASTAGPPSSRSNVMDQAGVIAYRLKGREQLEVLLIRRRHKRRWGIPKGVIEPDQTPRQAAVQEAIEEAGITGSLSAQPIGLIEYRKWNCPCEVQVYLMNVTSENEHYQEESFRERRWFDLPDALTRKTRKGIRPLLQELIGMLKNS